MRSLCAIRLCVAQFGLFMESTSIYPSTISILFQYFSLTNGAWAAPALRYFSIFKSSDILQIANTRYCGTVTRSFP